MQPGRNVVASTKLYGGTIQQFTNTIRKFGWSAKFVDFDDPKAIEAAIDDDTRALFCETICNPGGAISDLDAIARVADQAGIPLIVDNTTATPLPLPPDRAWRDARRPFGDQVSDRQRHGHRRHRRRFGQVRLVGLGQVPQPRRSPSPPITA